MAQKVSQCRGLEDEHEVENNKLYVRRRRGVVDVRAVALRLSDVARRRQALRARPIERDAASSVVHQAPILEVRHAGAAQSVDPSSAVVAFQRLLALRQHTLHAPGVAEISILSVVVERKIVHDSSPYILGNTIWRCGRTRDSYSLCRESMHTSVGTNSVTDVHAWLTVCRSQHNDLLMVLRSADGCWQRASLIGWRLYIVVWYGGQWGGQENVWASRRLGCK